MALSSFSDPTRPYQFPRALKSLRFPLAHARASGAAPANDDHRPTYDHRWSTDHWTWNSTADPVDFGDRCSGTEAFDAGAVLRTGLHPRHTSLQI
ncbi:hypothetical protein K523DRAFT_136958 [Schizophyllum commune Tattone D]|nr:hypothetical protein K523DRAFT_136958 [Schizophyllum commune Tattone D]